MGGDSENIADMQAQLTLPQGKMSEDDRSLMFVVVSRGFSWRSQLLLVKRHIALSTAADAKSIDIPPTLSKYRPPCVALIFASIILFSLCLFLVASLGICM